MKRTYILALLLMCITNLSYAVGYEWYGLANSSGIYVCNDLIYEGHHIYGVGEFSSSSITLGGNVLTNSGTTTKDVFVFKADTMGNVVWAKRFGDTLDETSNNLAIDNAGNILVTGSFVGQCTFGSTTLISSGGSDIFVLKLDNAGNVIWAKRTGGTADDIGNDVCADGSNNIYTISQMKNVVSFANVTSDSIAMGFIGVTKHDATGSEIWFKYFKATNTPLPYSTRAGVIKYNPTDNKIYVFANLFSSAMTISSSTVTFITFGSQAIAKVGFNTDSTIASSRALSYSTVNNGLSDAAIVQAGGIAIGREVTHLGGKSYGVSYDSTPGNTGYPHWDMSKYINYPGGVQFNKLSADSNEIYGAISIYASSPNCGSENLAQIKINDTIILHTMKEKVIAVANQKKSVFLGGQNYIAKACLDSTCAINSSGLKNFPDTVKCANNDIYIGYFNPCFYMTGGTYPLTYSWSPSVGLTTPNSSSTLCTAQATTQYVLTVTDALNNTWYDTVLVTVKLPANQVSNLSLVPSKDTVCSTDTINIQANYNGTPSSFQWSSTGTLTITPTATNAIVSGFPSFNVWAGRIIYLKLFDSVGCYIEASKVITMKPNQISVTGIPSNLSICSGDSITLSGTGGSGYSWSNGIQDGVPFAPPASNTYTVTGVGSNGCAGSKQAYVQVNQLPANSLNITKTPSSIYPKVCKGGSITLNGNGASSYTWNNGVTNNVPFAIHSSQLYTVTGTFSNGCKDTASIYIAVDTPNSQINSIPAGGNPLNICLGDSLTLFGSGGVTYNYIPSSVTNQVPFAPTVNQRYILFGINSNNCINRDTLDVVVNTPPTVLANSSISSNPVTLCQNDSLIVWGSGAQTYTWSSGVVDSVSFVPSSQSYVVTGSDAMGCSGIDTIAVNVNSLPSVVANSIQNTNPINVCISDSLVLWGSGAQTYSWSNGITDSVAFLPSSQSYFVTGMDNNNCVASDTVMVVVNPLPNPIITWSNDTLYCTNVSNINNYSWYHNGNLLNPNSSFIKISQNGPYVIIATDSVGCSGADTILVQNVSTNNVVPSDKIQVYPNPTSGLLTIQTSRPSNAKVEIVSPVGNIILSQEMTENKLLLNVSHLASGSYILRIYSENNFYYQKIILE